MNKLVSTQTDYLNRVKTLNYNETKFINGEAFIGISPFDSYFLFNIFHEVDGQDAYLDLTQSGTLYLNFFNSNEEIKIAQLSNVDNIDPKNGQVVFKINKNNAKKILGFNDNTFFISSKLEIGTDYSDESVLYTGKFYSYQQLPENLLRSENEKLKSEYNKLTKELTDSINTLTEENNTLAQTVNTLTNTLATQKELNDKLQNQLEEMKSKLSTNDAKQIEENNKVTNIAQLNSEAEAVIKTAQNLIKADTSTNISTKDIEKYLELKNEKNIYTFISKDNTKNQNNINNTEKILNKKEQSVSNADKLQYKRKL